ncbi:MAG: heat-inducible transcriptional repressor HrcA [Pseudomonadota bacterium]
MDIRQLNERNREIFRQIVETYLATGEPVGSRTISRKPGIGLSPASIRNVMADLEELGLLAAPHSSAGRQPTEVGLRLFVDGMLQVGDLASEERAALEARFRVEGRQMEDVLAEALDALSGLSQTAAMVLVPKTDVAVRHIEFVALGGDRALAILVGQDGSVENRIIRLAPGLPPSALTQAANYLNARLAGRTLEEARAEVEAEIRNRRAELDELTTSVVERGLAVWAGPKESRDQLIVRGRANLLEDVHALEDLERIRRLFDDLETKRDLMRVLELARDGEGVRVFIGSENNLFSLSGSSVIARPYPNGTDKIVGVIGVIGPTRINYARVVPLVDFTARLLSQML